MLSYIGDLFKEEPAPAKMYLLLGQQPRLYSTGRQFTTIYSGESQPIVRI